MPVNMILEVNWVIMFLNKRLRLPFPFDVMIRVTNKPLSLERQCVK